MVNFRDPTVITSDSWAVVKLCHALGSLYFWEFFTTLDYEWSVFRGHRPYRWTIWIYLLTRVATLVAVVLNIVGLDVTTKIDCQLWITLELVFGYLAFATASLLIVLRVIAIWNKNRVVVAIAVGVWVINIAFLIQGTARLRSVWVPAQKQCVVYDTESNKPNIIVTLITDIILLLIMLVGLLRLRRYGDGTFGLARLLWKQGIIWLFLATFAEVTPAVFISLNLNDVLNLMFQIPSMTIMTIAATRMYRSLADFASESTEVLLDNPQTVPRTKSASIPSTQREVASHTV
ncbi:hypothetical protein DFH94DRAFT_400751 [Russula ochroleuca]|jgi:hypothetical protein|uniref:Uncharacterized protein n=1 Tax=Russula ochroleuca TaxID=152965 RepID=A0A9P5MXX5_9AGAM|nr:hypothetical protein DFH94DRAFT_400751 [Russula ochroleuca]